MSRHLKLLRTLPLVVLASTSLIAAGAAAPASAAGAVTASQPVRAVSYAKAQVGDSYRYGGDGPSSWDCSGLTMRSYAKAGASVGGHSAGGQYRWAERHHRLVSAKHLKTGDIVFYGSGGSPYHVAIYAGHGRMVESPHEGAHVRLVALRHGDLMAKASRPER